MSNIKSTLKRNCRERTRIEVRDVDLPSYKNVERVGKRVRTELERRDGFMANVGVEMMDFELSEGIETTLTVNVVSTILTVIAVLLKLREMARKFNVQTNLSIVGSMVHALVNDKDMDVPEFTDILENLSRKETADMSKMLLHEAFHELCNNVSIKHPNDNVVLNIVNPGWCGSELGRYKQSSLPQRMIFALIGKTSEQGARTLAQILRGLYKSIIITKVRLRMVDVGERLKGALILPVVCTPPEDKTPPPRSMSFPSPLVPHQFAHCC